MVPDAPAGGVAVFAEPVLAEDPVLPDELELDEVPELVEELAAGVWVLDPLVVAKATEVPTPTSVPVRTIPASSCLVRSFILGLRSCLGPWGTP